MSETTDRVIRDNRMLLILVLGIFLMAVTGGGAYLWITRAHNPDGARKLNEGGPQSPVQPAFRNEPITITVYYPANGMLVAGTAAVKRQPDTQAQAREILAAVLSDQHAAQSAVFRDIKLKALYLDGQGTAYIDLVPFQHRDISASAGEEFLAIAAMVNTVMQNFDEIKQVRFLVDGREAQTLAGHIDLSRTYTKRMDLVKQ
ncbi:MAG TPA: GerMN domain-containing protein [Nitrospirota bacterium]|nr:GerMN domain-containing protein [Nitrospirota bacterium]